MTESQDCRTESSTASSAACRRKNKQHRPSPCLGDGEVSGAPTQSLSTTTRSATAPKISTNSATHPSRGFQLSTAFSGLKF
ncbi:hypothetical protein LINGRAHAP2_LOCUS28591 [Linum grandiflorum]